MAKVSKVAKVRRRAARIPRNLCFTHAEEIREIFRKAILKALRVHKALGNPVAEGRDGKVVWIPPEKIPVD